MPTCNPSPVQPREARNGGLDHFFSLCTCGLEIANTVRTNVEAEVREHLAYMAAKQASR